MAYSLRTFCRFSYRKISLFSKASHRLSRAILIRGQETLTSTVMRQFWPPLQKMVLVVLDPVKIPQSFWFGVQILSSASGLLCLARFLPPPKHSQSPIFCHLAPSRRIFLTNERKFFGVQAKPCIIFLRHQSMTLAQVGL
jgi:hypothetical protein